MANRRKPPAQRQGAGRQGKRETRDLAPTGGVSKMPPADKDWYVAVRRDWDSIPDSNLAPFITDDDLPLLRRLFDARDMRERIRRECRKKMLTYGSKGQPVANPLLAELHKFDALLLQIEALFGYGPANRLKLGIDLGKAAKSLDDMNAEFGGVDDSDDGEPVADPRLGNVIDIGGT